MTEEKAPKVRKPKAVKSYRILKAGEAENTWLDITVGNPTTEQALREQLRSLPLGTYTIAKWIGPATVEAPKPQPSRVSLPG